MTTNTEPMFWKTNKEWYRYNSEKEGHEITCYELTDKAPERARKSFEMYKKVQEDAKRGIYY